jgi:Spy/CpxP family protein refolding chaperone
MMIEIANSYLNARRALLLAAVLTVSCRALSAQSDGPGGPPPGGPPPDEMRQLSRGPSVERELKRLTQLLTLTSAQQAQVKTILTEEHQQMETLISQSKEAARGTKASSSATDDNNQPPNAEAMEKSRAAAKAIGEEAHAKIAAALTEDQRTKFAVWEEKREKATERQEGDDMPPPPDGDGGPPPDGGGGAPGGGGPPGV